MTIRSNSKEEFALCTRKNLYSFKEYYKMLSKKVSKSNIYFNVIVLIEELNLRFADM